MSEPLAEILQEHKDVRVPGGCDQCDAYQVLEQAAPRVWMLNVHHDADCPFLAEYEKKRRRR